MSDLDTPPRQDEATYRQGWRDGLTLGALAVAATAFINLLSVEKSILALALAWFAIDGAGAGAARNRGRLTFLIAGAHIALTGVVLFLFHDKLTQLIALLRHLG